MTPHLLPHTFGTWEVRNGAPTALVARLLGHADLRLTERVYVHLAARDLLEGARYAPLNRLGPQLGNPTPAA